MKIAIIRDGLIPFDDPKETEEAYEHAISVANAVYDVLKKKYEVKVFELSENILKELREYHVDLVFNLSNGMGGEGSLTQVPNLLEYGKIPYTASAPLGHGICYNKIFTTKILLENNVRSPKFFAVHQLSDIDDITFTYPLIVKPKDEGSSRGVHSNSFVENRKDLEKILMELLPIFDPPVMINEFLEGREFTVGVIGNFPNLEVLPILEIDFSNLPKGIPKIYSFEVKYQWEEKTRYHIPARIEENLKDEMENMAKKAFKVLDLKDYARIDFRLKEGQPYIIEVNSLPGLSPEYSDIVKMAESCGMSYEDLIFKIIDLAKERYKI